LIFHELLSDHLNSSFAADQLHFLKINGIDSHKEQFCWRSFDLVPQLVYQSLSAWVLLGLGVSHKPFVSGKAT